MIATAKFPAARTLLMAGTFIGIVAVVVGKDGKEQDAARMVGGTSKLSPVGELATAPELALLMGDLQRLTHKMALSAQEGNAELAAFYLHESLEQLQNIQKEVPEYEGQPVALLIDRMGLPAYDSFKAAVTAKPADRERMLRGLDVVIESCNACHVSTQHGLIRITRGTDVNPFNQSFKP